MMSYISEEQYRLCIEILFNTDNADLLVKDELDTAWVVVAYRKLNGKDASSSDDLINEQVVREVERVKYAMLGNANKRMYVLYKWLNDEL